MASAWNKEVAARAQVRERFRSGTGLCRVGEGVREGLLAGTPGLSESPGRVSEAGKSDLG